MGAAPDLPPRQSGQSGQSGQSTPRTRPPPPSLPLPLPALPPARAPKPNPLTSPLPSLRVLLHPTAGLGLDVRAPLSARTRCYLQLDSAFSGPSTVRIGVHPRRRPGVRLQLAPVPRLCVRAPVWLGGARYLHVGVWCGGGAGGAWAWRKGGVGVGVGVQLEVWRYSTGAGLMDERVRRGVREALRGSGRGEEAGEAGREGAEKAERDRIVEALKDALRERRRGRGAEALGKGRL